VSTAGDTSQQQQQQLSGGFDMAPFSRDIPVFYSIPIVIARDGDGSGSGQVDDGGSIGKSGQLIVPSWAMCVMSSSSVVIRLVLLLLLQCKCKKRMCD
jgi:hypothetical protein